MAAVNGIDHAQEWHAPHNPWIITVVATLSTFMEVLDTTIVNVALPHIAGNLGADVNDATWVLTSYLVSNAIVLPLSAWFSSLFGRRNYYMWCVGIFTASSFLCGIAPSLPMLVFFRLLQGIGGGGLQPSTQSILVDTFPPQKRGMGIALFGMTVVAAPVIGPTLGGWITDNYNWRWIFFINIPVGLFSLLMTPKFITDPPYLIRRHGKQKWNIDFVGLGLIALGIGALQIMLDLGERKGWLESNFIITAGIVSVLALVFGVIWEMNHRDPVVNLRLLGESNLGMSTAVMFVFGVTLYGSTVLLPLLMQTLLGYDALLSGLAISPGGIVIFVLMPFIGIAVNKLDIRAMITFGIVVIGYSLYEMGHFSLDVNFGTLVWAQIVQSFGLAFIFVPVNTIAYAYVPRELRNSASSLISVTRNVGGSIGIALATSLVSRRAQVHQSFLVSHLTPHDPAYTNFLHQASGIFYRHSGDMVNAKREGLAALYGMVQQQSHMLGFMDTFYYLALSIFLVIPLTWFMKRPKTTGGDMPVH